MKSITILMLLMILLATFFLQAQTKIGITAGASFANVTIKSGGISISPKIRSGITAGLFADAPLSANFHFQPALNFVQKGYIIEDETATDNLNLNFLEVPLNFVYSNKGFFVGAGPSVAYGFSGKEKFTDKSGGTGTENNTVRFGSGDEEIKALDLGANATAGYKFAEVFIITANYTLGLNNIQNGSVGEDGSVKNKYFAIKIGYMFGGNKKNKSF